MPIPTPNRLTAPEVTRNCQLLRGWSSPARCSGREIEKGEEAGLGHSARRQKTAGEVSPLTSPLDPLISSTQVGPALQEPCPALGEQG